jgi:hypothetical protein
VLLVLEAILWGAFTILVLLGYLTYYSYKALKYVLRHIYHKLKGHYLNAPSFLRYDKNNGELEEEF